MGRPGHCLDSLISVALGRTMRVLSMAMNSRHSRSPTLPRHLRVLMASMADSSSQTSSSRSTQNFLIARRECRTSEALSVASTFLSGALNARHHSAGDASSRNSLATAANSDSQCARSTRVFQSCRRYLASRRLLRVCAVKVHLGVRWLVIVSHRLRLRAPRGGGGRGGVVSAGVSQPACSPWCFAWLGLTAGDHSNLTNVLPMAAVISLTALFSPSRIEKHTMHGVVPIATPQGDLSPPAVCQAQEPDARRRPPHRGCLAARAAESGVGPR